MSRRRLCMGQTLRAIWYRSRDYGGITCIHVSIVHEIDSRQHTY